MPANVHLPFTLSTNGPPESPCNKDMNIKLLTSECAHHTSVLLSILISGAHHLGEYSQVDPSGPVPLFTFVVFNDGNVNFLQ